jgi:hypothetical protein
MRSARASVCADDAPAHPRNARCSRFLTLQEPSDGVVGHHNALVVSSREAHRGVRRRRVPHHAAPDLALRRYRPIMAYAWNGIRFDVPDGVVDQSVLTFVDDPTSPSFQLTMTTDRRGAQAFSPWVEAQLKELARALPGYAATRHEQRNVHGNPALFVEHRARSPQGQPMRQRQAYVDLAALDRVAILTLTHADKDTPKATAVFDTVLASLQ